MFRETEPVLSGFSPSAPPAGLPQNVPLRNDARAESDPPETLEQEIARLTWSVLDGGASLMHRQRLAELVNSQHARRASRDAS